MPRPRNILFCRGRLCSCILESTHRHIIFFQMG